MLSDADYADLLGRLDRALDLAPADRAAFADAQADLGEDARAELTALVAAATADEMPDDDTASGPATAPADDSSGAPGPGVRGPRPRAGRVDTRLDRSASDLIGDDDRDTSAVETGGGALTGERLGAWRLGPRIGAGGMAVVYEATRDDGLYAQRAAVKVMRADLFGDDLAARFARERRVLAHLDHPALTRLLDGGATPDGRPYFVMEFVEGTPITDALATAPLDARIDAFARACDAVAHAHRGLVVHRDLKPAHVVVEASGAVRLLDFGIARLLDGDGGGGLDDDALTHVVAPRTLAYAAPEQLSGAPVTTATDVYALGLVLYELLTGSRAFAATRARTTTDEVPRPSAASGLDAATRRRLRGDLDAIVTRATCLHPSERTPSADALAADLRRVLRHEPVHARRGTVGYRARRFVRRHRAVLLAAAVAAVALGAALAVAHDRQAAADAADARAARGAAYLSGLLDATTPYAEDSLAVTAEMTMGDFLGVAAHRARRDLATDPPLLADVLASLGKSLYDAERMPDAERALVDALALYERGGHATGEAAMSARHHLVKALIFQERFADADRAGARYLAIARTLPDDTLRVHALLRASEHTRSNDASRALVAEAESLLDRAGIDASAVREALVGAQMRDADATGNVARVLDLHAEEYRLVRTRRGDGHALTAVALTNYAMALGGAGRTTEALDAFDRALPVLTRQGGGESDNVLALLNARANALDAAGRHAESIAQHRDVLARRLRRPGLPQSDIAASWQNLGVALSNAGRYGEAADACRRAAAIYAATVPPDAPHRYYPLITLARLERLAGRPADAIETARAAERGLAPLLSETHRARLTTHLYLGLALDADGQRAAARSVLRDARAALLALTPPDSAGAAEADAALAVRR